MKVREGRLVLFLAVQTHLFTLYLEINQLLLCRPPI